MRAFHVILGVLIVGAVGLCVYAYWPEGDSGPSLGDLRQLAREGTDEERAAAIVKLGRSGAEGMGEVVKLWQEKPGAGMRLACVRVLGDGFYYEGMDVLLEGVADADAEVRRASAQAVGRMLGMSVEVMPTGDVMADAKRRQEMMRTAWGNIRKNERFEDFRKRVEQQMETK